MSRTTTAEPREVSAKQLAANRSNAARSTGPRTPEGKARSAQNARKHGLCADAFTLPRLENIESFAELRADATACYRPVNSQERNAVQRIAFAQLEIERLSRVGTGLFTSLLDQAMSPCRDARPGLSGELDGDSATGAHLGNYYLGEAFRQMNPKLYVAFLRHQSQAERFYRRAVEEFDRLKSRRAELAEDLPNEPIAEPDSESPQPVIPAPDALNEPVSPPEIASAPPPPAPPLRPPEPTDPVVSTYPVAILNPDRTLKSSSGVPSDPVNPSDAPAEAPTGIACNGRHPTSSVSHAAPSPLPCRTPRPAHFPVTHTRPDLVSHTAPSPVPVAHPTQPGPVSHTPPSPLPCRTTRPARSRSHTPPTPTQPTPLSQPIRSR